MATAWAPAAALRPPDLLISASPTEDVHTTPTSTQVNNALWFGCTAASPVVQSSSTTPPGHATLKVQAGRRVSTAPEGNLSPHGRSSTCSSPKTPEQIAAAQLRSLQKTPLPLVLARMKVLLERINMLIEDGSCTSAASTPAAMPAGAATGATTTGAAETNPFFFCEKATHGQASSRAQPLLSALHTHLPGASGSAMHHGWHPSSNTVALSEPAGQHSRAGTVNSRLGGAAARGSHQGGVHAASSSSSNSSSPMKKPGGPKKPARGLIEVSTSGGLANSVMKSSAQSILDELDVTLGFISDFLASLSPSTRKALATVARLESYKKDQLIFDIGDQASFFYVVLSGRIDIWSHPPGVHRPKSIVSVLRRGDAFGDQAIINQEAHGTAASPATNVTLLVITRQDFLVVLGSHFQQVADTWQRFLVTHVAPLADSDTTVVRRLCSTLVNEKPAEGQECSIHEDQVCFIQAGTFELRLVDLQAECAAKAALAAAIASASSALTITPIPPHLHRGAVVHNRRPATAPAAGRLQPAVTPAKAVSTAPSSAAAAAAASSVSTSKVDAATGTCSTSGDGQGQQGVEGPAAGVAAGLQMLQASSADLPTLGTEGVLASVRVKDGRLVGTQGLAKQLRQQHSTRVPYKVVAELGPGGWFGGGEAVYGSGPLQSALRVVAAAPDCQMVHAHLSGLEKHGGPALIKRLRDDAAFKLTYYLGRLGVLPVGAAVGHPATTLVAQAAVAAAAASGPATRLPTGIAGQVGSASCGASPGRGPCSTFRSQPAAATAVAAGGGKVVGRAPGRPATSAAASRPSSAPKPGRKGAVADSLLSSPLQRSGSNDSSSSSTWDDCQVGVMMPPGHRDEASGSAAAVAAADDAASSMLVKAGRPRQRRNHVPGSGVFGQGVMAALQHVQSLQANATCGASGRPSTAPGQTMSSRHAGSLLAASIDSSSTTQPPAAAAACKPSSSSSSSSRITVSANKPEAEGGVLGIRPASGCRARPAAAEGCGTAADVYWQQPEHNSTATGTALSGLLSNLFTDGLQPLVSELDRLISYTNAHQHHPVLQQLQQPSLPQQLHLQAGSVPELQQQRRSDAVWNANMLWGQQQQQGWQQREQHARPSSAAARLQHPAGLWWPGSEGAHVQKPRPCAADAEVLQHKPAARLLAASVMWQHNTFRPPLRQCLTTTEIAQQHSSCADTGTVQGTEDVPAQ